MSFMANPDYSLRYDWRGREKEENFISHMLSASDFRIDEVNELISPQFQAISEAIEISRKYHYDLDVSISYGWLKIAIYKKPYRQFNLTPLIPLFATANWISVDSLSFGRTVKLTANYIFTLK